MRQIVRYRFMTIPNKLYADVRVTIDDTSRAEVNNKFDGGRSINLTLLPMINIQMLKPLELDSTGRKFRPRPNGNDSVGLTKMNLPTFVNELKRIHKELDENEELYTYRGDRLDLNDTMAEKVRRAFLIGRVAVELRAVVIEQVLDTGITQREKGIKMKFNNEESTVLLTMVELEAMIWIMDNVDIDNLVLSMYLTLVERSAYQPNKPVVDIQPMAKPMYVQHAAEPVAIAAIEEPKPVETKAEAPKKKEPKQETIIDIPAEKYKDAIDFDSADLSDFMNPPEEASK